MARVVSTEALSPIEPRVPKGPGSRSIRVLIINSSGLMGKAVAALLEAEPGFEIVGMVKGCSDCQKCVATLRPDVVLCDLDAEAARGPHSLGRFRHCLPDVPVVVLSGDDSEQRVLQLVKVGIQGFVTKDSSRRTLVDAIRSASRGGCFLERGIQSKLMRLFANGGSGRDPWQRPLSEREQRILRLMVDGLTNGQIAQKVFLSTSAVKYHNAAIFKKLGVSGRAQAIKAAIQQALV